jgi:putative addiction module CopG family antidote
MAISFSPETEKLLEEKLKSGEFQSADEMIRVALQALEEIDMTLDEETLDAIDRAEEEGERGEGYDLEDVKEYFRAKYPEKP